MPSIEDAVRILNEAFMLDKEAIQELTFHRVRCNNELAEHPTITVHQTSPDSQCEVGILGILNGIFGSPTQRIALSISDKTGEALGFRLVEVK